MISQSIGMLLLLIFYLASLRKRPHSSPPIFSSETLRLFYVTTTLLAFSITTACFVTFWNRRAQADILYAKFGYMNFYAYSTLALASPLSIMPAVVLVTMSTQFWKKAEKDPQKSKSRGENRKLHLAQTTISILYLFSVGAIWVIWSVGIKNRSNNPTSVVFGGYHVVRLSNFLFRNTGTYIFVLGILMTALPVAGLIPLAIILLNPTRQKRFLEPFRAVCCAVYLAFGLAQFGMFVYIRSQAIYQVSGKGSEMDWGFGQILVLFTWAPLLMKILPEIVAWWSTCIADLVVKFSYHHIVGAP
jgi:hypothetical protein